MKRLTFLAGLIGLPLLGQKRNVTSAASVPCSDCVIQDVPAIRQEPWLEVEGRRLHWFSGNALNNQCPVCGTMAEPLKKTGVMWLNDTGDIAEVTGESLARCKRCNAGFWRDWKGK